jgi:hypothetical protein
LKAPSFFIFSFSVQALEVLILKRDARASAAFAAFFTAEGPTQKLEQLEALSLSLRQMAREELDRLRASIAEAAPSAPAAPAPTRASAAAAVTAAPRTSAPLTTVAIDEDSEDDERDPFTAMTAALASTLDHLGLEASVKEALMNCGDEERVMIIAAIDVFQQTRDVDDLKDTLKRIARLFVEHQRFERLEVRP